MTSRPVGQEGHCFYSCCSSPWPRKEFDWNGDVDWNHDFTATSPFFMTSRPVDQEGHCFYSCCSSPWPRKEFDWNGDVATRMDCVPQKLNSSRNIYPKG